MVQHSKGQPGSWSRLQDCNGCVQDGFHTGRERRQCQATSGFGMACGSSGIYIYNYAGFTPLLSKS